MIEKRLNYIGSKYNLVEFLHVTIEQYIDIDLKDATFCDLFSGTSIVSRYFSPLVKSVIANDMEYYSYVLAHNYLCSDTTCNNPAVFDMLNNLTPKKGLFFHHYSEASKEKRLYFTQDNAKKIDAIREKIDELYCLEQLSKPLYYHLLASLIESCDVIANTTSVYSAYLKQIKKSAKTAFKLQAATYAHTHNRHRVYNEDANVLIEKIRGDILYLDPPYNIRQYGSNYHILNSLISFTPFTPQGITGIREYKRSKYCSKKHIYQTLYELIQKANFSYIFMSYSDDGILTPQQIEEIFSHFGRYYCVTKQHIRYKNYAKKERTYITEYLHILKKHG